MNLVKAATRAFAVVGKEMLVVIRRPSALATLVIGPVAILAVFGLSYVGQPPIRAMLVVPADSGLPADAGAYDLNQTSVLHIVGTRPNLAAAREALASGSADIIVAAPDNAVKQLLSGKQVVIQIEYDTVNPYQNAVISRLAEPLAAKVNEKIVAAIVAEAGSKVTASNKPDPSFIAAPTSAQTRDVAPTEPKLIAFYGVAVLALIVQHLGLTLGALSMNSDRRQGMLTLLRVAPVSALEILTGKYVAFVVLTGAITAALVALMTQTMGVPMLAPVGSVVGLLLLLIVASVGLGLVLSLVTSSESQVIQLALLALLASVFFGGLAIDLSQFAPPLQIAAQFLPVTEATRLGQDLFLRGAATEPWRFGALAAMAVGLTIVALALLRRELMRRR
jgi:ABC-2 type transport system permease protein